MKKIKFVSLFILSFSTLLLVSGCSASSNNVSNKSSKVEAKNKESKELREPDLFLSKSGNEIITNDSERVDSGLHGNIFAKNRIKFTLNNSTNGTQNISFLEKKKSEFSGKVYRIYKIKLDGDTEGSDGAKEGYEWVLAKVFNINGNKAFGIFNVTFDNDAAYTNNPEFKGIDANSNDDFYYKKELNDFLNGKSSSADYVFILV